MAFLYGFMILQKASLKALDIFAPNMQLPKALEVAISKANLKCEAVPDGATVIIDNNTSYEPDALVYCGNLINDNELVVPTPVILVEVLSPSTAYRDITDKLVDYFKLGSAAHYLILDPKTKRITHYYREGDKIAQKAVYSDRLNLTPPGMTLDLATIFS